mmetsp:Transcript_41332/g.89567  ORF Transcript_41332/g.89567 Transcript_41332/m.89567 type:complete len:247 (-) Transcript_41332:552-1292(-)
MFLHFLFKFLPRCQHIWLPGPGHRARIRRHFPIGIGIFQHRVPSSQLLEFGDLMNPDPLLVMLGKGGGDHSHRNGRDEDASKHRNASHELAEGGVGDHVAIAHRRDGRHGPPERSWNGDKVRVRCINLCGINHGGTDQSPHTDKRHEDDDPRGGFHQTFQDNGYHLGVSCHFRQAQDSQEPHHPSQTDHAQGPQGPRHLFKMAMVARWGRVDHDAFHVPRHGGDDIDLIGDGAHVAPAALRDDHSA